MTKQHTDPRDLQHEFFEKCVETGVEEVLDALAYLGIVGTPLIAAVLQATETTPEDQRTPELKATINILTMLYETPADFENAAWRPCEDCQKMVKVNPNFEGPIWCSKCYNNRLEGETA